jgi:predicted PurR-regulated permease PerM
MDRAVGTPDEPPTRLRLTTWSIVRAVAVVGMVIVVIRVLGAASTPLWWLAIAAVVAAMLQPLALVLDRWLPSGVAIAVVAVLTALAIGWVGYRGISEIQIRVDQLAQAADDAAKQLEVSDSFGEVATEVDLDGKVQALFEGLPVALGGGDAGDTISAAASGGGAAIAIGMFVLLLMVFGQRLVVSGLAQIDRPEVRARVTSIVGAAYGATARYAVFMVGRAIVVGVGTAVVASVLGLPVPTALGLWVGAWSMVPAVGIVVGALAVALVALLSSPVVAALAVPVAVAVQLGDIVVVQRRIDRASLRVGPAATLLAAIVGLELYGVGGMAVMVWVTVFFIAVVHEMRTLGDDPRAAFDAVEPADVVGGGASPAS